MSNNENVKDLFDDGESRPKNYQNQTKPQFNADNYLNTRLEKNEKSRKIKFRIVLTKDVDGKYKMAIPVKVHKLKLTEEQNHQKKIAASGFKSFMCLNDKHIDDANGCPFCDKMNELFREAKTITDSNERKSICREAYRFEAKTSYIIRGIERGKEQDGIKFWRFGKHDDGSGVYDELKDLYMLYKFPTDANGEEYMITDSESGETIENPNYVFPSNESEDIFDYREGRDIIITLSQAEKKTPGGPDKTAIKIMIDNRQTPLASTEEEINAILNDDKDWRNMYRTKSYEFLNILANNQTPVYDTTENKFVPWVDLSSENKKTEEIANEALKEYNSKTEENKSDNPTTEQNGLPY